MRLFLKRCINFFIVNFLENENARKDLCDTIAKMGHYMIGGTILTLTFVQESDYITAVIVFFMGMLLILGSIKLKNK